MSEKTTAMHPAEGVGATAENKVDDGAEGREYDDMTAAIDSFARVLEEDSSDAAAWSERLKDAANELAAEYGEHRDAAEAERGSLSRLVSKKPALSNHVETLKKDHVDLLLRIEGLVKDIESAEDYQEEGLRMDRIKLAAGVVRDALRLHMATGADLMYDAFFQEEGGEQG